MSQQKEDSVMFSLRSLMEIEEERIKQEEDSKRRAEEETRLRAEEARRREEEEKAAKIRAAEEARLAEERRRQEEEDKRKREREEAELRIRLQAESQEREREMQRRLEHEQKMALIEAQKAKGIPAAAVAGIIFVLAAGVGLGGFYGYYRPHMQELQAQENARRAAIARAAAARLIPSAARDHAISFLQRRGNATRHSERVRAAWRTQRNTQCLRGVEQSTTLNNGYLGSCNDEDRSELRYVV